MGVLYARETPQDNFTPVSTMGVGIASQSQAGLMSVPDKVKLDGLITTIPDYSNDAVLHTFSTNDSWTASEDCAIVGYMRYNSSQGGYNSGMSANGVIIGVAYTNGVTSYAPVFAFVSAGDVITTEPQGQYDNIKAYKFKTTD